MSEEIVVTLKSLNTYNLDFIAKKCIKFIWLINIWMCSFNINALKKINIQNKVLVNFSFLIFV